MNISRRSILAGPGVAVAAIGLTKPALAREFVGSLRFPDPAVEVLDPRFRAMVIATTAVERLATGFRWAEGPVWMGDSGTLIFSDVQMNTLYRWDERTAQVTPFRKPSNHSNGNARDRQGRLLTCEHRGARVTRTEHDGSITVLADSFEGKSFNAPNDIVCKSDGTIWFTDPTFGPQLIEGSSRPTGPSRVFRLDPESRRGVVVASDMNGPNGLAFSPDETKLYVIEARSTPNRTIRIYDVASDNRLANGRVFFEATGGLTLDGMRIDTNGNLWCGSGMSAANDGVVVLAADDATMIGRIHLPERCANLCFGGVDRNRLLMPASTSLYALYVNAQGAKLV